MLRNIDVKQPYFSFLHDGVPFAALIASAQIKEQRTGDQRSIVCRLPDGLTVTRTARVFDGFDACHWMLCLEHAGERNSKRISTLKDCDLELGFTYVPVPRRGYNASKRDVHIFSTFGSTCVRSDFYARPESLTDGAERRYASVGGRSSDGIAPFFDINQQEKEYLLAVGWTGQWNVAFRANAG